MNFARRQLEKYGWAEGKGLGKDGNGISEPIKPKIKHSLTGVGFDPATDFTQHWWSVLYDKAASNLEVQNKKGSTTKIRKKSKEEFEITTSIWKLKRKKNEPKSEVEYSDFFVKTTLIGKGGENAKRIKLSESESEDESDQKNNLKMTDDDLFAACKGRTAHKGAHLGLRALGKLARVEQQDKILLQQAKYKGYSHHEKIKNNNKDLKVIEEVTLHSDSEGNIVKQKKKKKKRCRSTENTSKIPVTSEMCDFVLEERNAMNNRKSIKSKAKIESSTLIGSSEDIVKSKKRKQKQ